jgi:23S rRNA pseudoU1915 N3-methylase RlmH
VGLLDFLKKDEYKDGGSAGNQGQLQPVNLGQQPATQSPLLPGSNPAPIPQNQQQSQTVTPQQAQQSVGGQQTQIDQIQPYSPNPVQNGDGFTPIQEQPTGGYMDNFNAPTSNPTQDMGAAPQLQGMTNDNSGEVQVSNQQEETIFGDGDLSDIYSQNFPEPQNIEPTAPGQNLDFQNNNVSSEPVASMPDQPSGDSSNVSGTTDNMATDTQESSNVTVQAGNESANIQNMDSQPEVQQAVQGSTPQFEMPNIDMEAIMSSAKKATEAAGNLNQPQPKKQVESASDIPQAKEIKSEPKEVEVKPEKKEKKEEPKINKVENKEKPKSTRNVFKKIAILGLDGPNTNSLDLEGITQMSKNLLSQKVELILGTDKGHSSKLVSNIQNPKSRISTVSLHPVLTVNGSEKVQTESQTNNFAVIYSNYIEWLRHLMKEARMFILFDGAGLQNHSVLVNLINISQMYGEGGKPIILVGESWKMKVDSLMKAGLFKAEDVENVHILNNTDELQAKLDELNSKYASNSEPQYARVVDRRVEGDEKEFVVY